MADSRRSSGESQPARATPPRASPATTMARGTRADETEGSAWGPRVAIGTSFPCGRGCASSLSEFAPDCTSFGQLRRVGVSPTRPDWRSVEQRKNGQRGPGQPAPLAACDFRHAQVEAHVTKIRPAASDLAPDPVIQLGIPEQVARLTGGEARRRDAKNIDDRRHVAHGLSGPRPSLAS